MKYVYVLRGYDQHYKIGIASNVKRRLAGIQTSNQHKIEVVTTKLADDAAMLESALHQYLDSKRSSGGREWFKLTDHEALELCIILHRNSDVDLRDNMNVLQALDHNRANQNQILSMLAHTNKILSTLTQHVQSPEPAKTEDSDIQLERAKRAIARDDSLMRSKAMEVFRTEGRASTSLLQRKLKIGYSRAARIVDELAEAGIISAPNGVTGRKYIGINYKEAA